MEYKEYVFTIHPVQPARDVLIAELCEMEFDSFDEIDSGLKAYSLKEYESNDFQNLLSYNMEGVSIEVKKNAVESQNWNAEWEKSFEPIEVEDKCYIRAPFHASRSEFDQEVIIQPKMSFGTGHHETTFLVCKKMFSLDFKEKTVLDMGSGTGVLAILAEKLGAFHVDAIDIDEWSFENTLENIQLNGSKHIEVFLGDKSLLKDQQYDIILANINRNILLADMDTYKKVLKPNGIIVFSGFYTHDKPMILEKAVSLGMKEHSFESKNDWVALRVDSV